VQTRVFEKKDLSLCANPDLRIAESLQQKFVIVENCGLKISGKLLHIENSRKRRSHRPSLVILEDSCGGKVIVRDWSVILADESLMP